MEELICDFCGAPNATHIFKAKTFAMKDGVLPPFVSIDDWVACDECARLIRLEWWKSLEDRAIAKYRDFSAFMTEEKIRSTIRQSHEGFRRFREK